MFRIIAPVVIGLTILISTSMAVQRWEKTVEGCLHFNPYSEPNETISWTGSCVDGKISGSGTLTYSYMLSGSQVRETTVGNAREGKLNGEGVQRLTNGYVFEGTFKNNNRHFGKVAKPNGDWFLGHFRRNRAAGKGECGIDGKVGKCWARKGTWTLID